MSDRELSSLCGIAPTQIPDLVASIDARTVADAEEARNLIREGLKTFREPIVFNALWDYYMKTNSINAATLLTGVPDSQSQRFFEKLNDSFLNVKTRLLSLGLIGYLIRRESPPSWLHKIVETPLFLNILRCLKSEYNVSILMGALLAVTALLPSIPVTVGPYLRELCDIFMRLLAWLCSTYLGDVSEVLVLHLRVGVYAYFHRLYAMYPNHFLQYLQTQFNAISSESVTDLREAIKPYLESVRLHPYLVIGNRQSETNVYRWRKYDAPAILEECSKLCLDPSLTCPSQDNSVGFPSPEKIDPVTPSTSGAISPSSSQSDLSLQVCPPTSSSEVDSALHSRPTTASSSKTIISELESSASLSSSSMTTLPGTQKKDDDSRDLMFNSSCDSGTTTCTPKVFVEEEASLTLNWSKEAHATPPTSRQNRPSSLGSSFTSGFFQKTGNSTSSRRRRRHTLNVAHHQRSISLDITFPEMSTQDFSSMARPASMWESDGNLPAKETESETKSTVTSVATATTQQVSELTTDIEGKSPALAAPATVSLDVLAPKRVIRTFSNLLPSALPIPANVAAAEGEEERRGSGEQIKAEKTPTGGTAAIGTAVPAHQILSPVNLLDRHLELGRVLHAKESSSIPMTYLEGTDWSHFGESPQADEVAILKSQVLLLHTQLMYERHLREQHDKRNRSLLRRSHQANKAEEELWALKNQLELRNKEFERAQAQIKVEADREKARLEMNHKMEDVLREQLRISADENQIARESEAAAVKEAKQLRRDMEALKKEIELANEEKFRWQREVEEMGPKAKAAEQLQIELDALSREFLCIADLFEDRLQVESSYSKWDSKVARLESELAALRVEKKAIEDVSCQREAQMVKYRSKAEGLEVLLKEKTTAFEQQRQVIDDIKNRNQAQLKAVEEKCSGLKVANQYLETHIMELYGRRDFVVPVVGSDSSSLASTPGLSCLFPRSADDAPHVSSAGFSI